RILESTMAQGDKKSQKPILELQQQLFENTNVGKKLFAQAKETEAAIKILQEASKKGLTRENLLKILINSKSDIQISTIASLARTGLDYGFFQLLSEKIDSEKENSKKKELTELREKLLQITEELDKQIREQMLNAKQLIEKIISAEDIKKEMGKNIHLVNEFFVQVLQSELSTAKKDGNLDRIQKLEQVMKIIKEASAPPEEVQLFEKLLEYKDENDLAKQIKDNGEKINQNFLDMMNNIVTQVQKQKIKDESIDKVRAVYKAVLKYSMTKKMEEN
ncbi:MAG: hypothetical protein J7L66_05245, partial [Anaerolineaceae bacterium]|nr:hypothetical protein [Anaerolineaceae bacterium]